MDGGSYGGVGSWPYGGPPAVTGWPAEGTGESGSPPPGLPPRPRRRLRRALIASVVAAAIGVVGVLSWPAASQGSAAGAAGSSTAPSAGASASTSADTAAAAKRDLDTAAIISKRADALLHGDIAGWLADVDPDQPALVAHERMLYANLHQLPLVKFGWSPAGSAGPTFYDVPSGVSSTFYKAAATYSAPYVLRYQFRGYDRTEIEDPYAPVFLLRDGKWLLAADQTAGKTYSYRVEPWNNGPIAVGTGKRTLVVVSASDAKRLPQLVSQADAAVQRVTSMWPSGWAHRAVLYDTREGAVFADYLGKGLVTADFGGVTRAIGPDGAAPGQEDLRVVMNPQYDAPGSKQLPALLTHEFTHVAKWSDTSRGTPIWAIEGIAEFTAYRGHPQDGRVSAQIGSEGRAGRLPKTLPRSSGFTSHANVEFDYGMSWLAFEFLSERYGENKVRLLYERLAKITTPADSPAALKTEAQAFQAVVHTSEAKFVSGLDKWIGQVIRPVH